MFGPNYHPLADLNHIDEALAHAHAQGAFTDKPMSFTGDVLSALRRLAVVLRDYAAPPVQPQPKGDCDCPDGDNPKG